MMKIIKIKHCEDCPDYSYRDYVPPFCTIEEREIPDIFKIPPWCPLEDAPNTRAGSIYFRELTIDDYTDLPHSDTEEK